MEWNDETILRLRGLWADGHSTAEIGRRLGVSKNAVVGKAHRLGLAARPSPIRREASGRPRPPVVRRVVGPTLPPLPATAPDGLAPAANLAAANLAAANLVPAAPRLAPPPAPTAVSPPAPAPAPAPGPRAIPASRGVRPQACCWPLGEPGTKSFRFCDGESLTGKPYCAEHAQLAYVRVRDRREEAA